MRPLHRLRHQRLRQDRPVLHLRRLQQQFVAGDQRQIRTGDDQASHVFKHRSVIAPAFPRCCERSVAVDRRSTKLQNIYLKMNKLIY